MGNVSAQSTTPLAAELDIKENYRSNRFRPLMESLGNSDKGIILPFGYSLFDNRGELESNSAIQPEYVLRNGDVISVWIWGAFEYQQQHKVDSRGQIFLEQLGPVKVAGVSVTNLSDYLRDKLAKVYHQGVELYANLYQVAPIPLLVSGAVNAPGQYLGSSGDGILYYLSKAQGIDIRQGSYRRIQVRRAGKTVANIDLYPFLQSGELPSISLQDFDVIFVSQSGVRVTAILPGKIPLSYELIQQPYQGQELLSLLTVPKYIIQVKLVSETPSGNVEQTYSLEEFRRLTLNDGDRVFFTETLNQGSLGRPQKRKISNVLPKGERHGPG
ncbi:polysaccharide biosynthesis/export family protein [Thalassotalea litorea]|uniref:polysaccharide biosynthesis/export family protein n=1 Tax=Thalassotalea litorea TaxID=2020715 RepID=UPI00373621C5